MYRRSVLVLDPGMHTAVIRRIDADREGRFLATASYDKTVRVWAAADGRLLRTIRLPAGPGSVGAAYAAAISPDGALVAAGGYTGTAEAGFSVYLFDQEKEQLRRVGALPQIINHLAFSPDGSRLIAALGRGGVRLIDPNVGRIVKADEEYYDQSYAAAFDPASGRLATTSLDRGVRLYDSNLGLLRVIAAPSGKQPLGIAFSPDGGRLAIGYHEAPGIDVLDGATLDHLFAADTMGLDNSILTYVAWSADGCSLYGAGWAGVGDWFYLRRWPEGGRGAPVDLPLSRNNQRVLALCPLPAGRIAFATGGPRLGMVGAEGSEGWTLEPPMATFNGQREDFAVSADGAKVRFYYEWGDRTPALFSVLGLQLESDGSLEGLTMARTEAPELMVEHWTDSRAPTLNGRQLALTEYEIARSLAVTPDGQRFVLGTEWWLRFFDWVGRELWRQRGPGTAWAVNVTGDGRLVVVAYGDGTIRWYRTDNGIELLAFFPLADRTNWVAWTPEGLYAATPGARGALRWCVNHGWEQLVNSIPVYEIPEQHRPDVLPLVLQEMDEVRALGLVARKKIREAVYRRTGVDPAARLHLLAIGVSEYKEEHARYLRLRFADADARDVASALSGSQNSLYADVTVQMLQNEDATRRSILRALYNIRERMEEARRRDLAVVQFSGHGAIVDGELYLLPHEIDPGTTVELKDTALSFAQLRQELVGIAQHGRVLVLLDACHSGTATMDGAKVVLDAAAARAALAGPNVTVLTSTAPSDPSFENERWANGAFTEAFLDALRSHADRDNDGLLSVGDIEWHVARLLPELTGGRQGLGIEKRFDGNIFVAGV